MSQKYRIITITTNEQKTKVFRIQRKRWFGWNTICIKENANSKYLEFNTSKEAEQHMFENYFNSFCGSEVTIIGKVYHVSFYDSGY